MRVIDRSRLTSSGLVAIPPRSRRMGYRWLGWLVFVAGMCSLAYTLRGVP